MEQVVADVSPELLHKTHPGSTATCIASIYAHAVIAEDQILNGMVMGRAPIFNADVSAKTGVPMKQGPAQEAGWAGSINMNLPAFREYSQQVYASTEKILAELDDAKASEMIDTPFGNKQPRQEFIGNLGVTHMWGHLGEIAALKGVEGIKGLPF
jgi:hypothetical protein